MRLLVTGGCGFIGSNFIRYIVRQHPDWTVVNFDALTYAGNPENLVEVSAMPNYHFVRGDITDTAAVRNVFIEGVDAVVHFAAESHVDRSIHDASPFVRTNVLGTQVLLNAARKFGVSKFVQVSTDEVYGTLGETGYFTEATPLAPNSPYSASKASADLLARAYHETYGLPVIVSRCSNNYGPYQFPEKLVPLAILNAYEDKEIPVYGDGKNVRDWLHVEDHCRALDLVLQHGRPGDVYNVGGNNEHQNIEVVRTILSILGKPESLIRFVTDRPGHDRRYAIDASKIRRELGWQPVYNFEDGLRETVNWYISNLDWCHRVRSGEYRSFYELQYGERLGIGQ
ncbi:dTDP-glucose 4,6-dehydratase [Alicyclobacillus macrosporangiidus]|uniref:dTDP-glucose 4,6-dehydratase n=1 Tax=Alicyclobacillus macrosporangiidus TaxID=392015 RepID=UPI0004965EE8|nr:dTDP-glucose 4,6-dehydratase [Alicyclobacillus macrosporangiidus]